MTRLTSLIGAALFLCAGDAVAQFSFLTHFETAQRGVLELRGLIFFFGFIALCAALNTAVGNGEARQLNFVAKVDFGCVGKAVFGRFQRRARRRVHVRHLGRSGPDRARGCGGEPHRLHRDGATADLHRLVGADHAVVGLRQQHAVGPHHDPLGAGAQ